VGGGFLASRGEHALAISADGQHRHVARQPSVFGAAHSYEFCGALGLRESQPRAVGGEERTKTGSERLCGKPIATRPVGR
jgi:hypothetical protein